MNARKSAIGPVPDQSRQTHRGHDEVCAAAAEIRCRGLGGLRRPLAVHETAGDGHPPSEAPGRGAPREGGAGRRFDDDPRRWGR